MEHKLIDVMTWTKDGSHYVEAGRVTRRVPMDASTEEAVRSLMNERGHGSTRGWSIPVWKRQPDCQSGYDATLESDLAVYAVESVRREMPADYEGEEFITE